MMAEIKRATPAPQSRTPSSRATGHRPRPEHRGIRCPNIRCRHDSPEAARHGKTHGQRQILRRRRRRPGGAGKSTLIDELTSRFLRASPTGRIALLANDPSHPDSAAPSSATASAPFTRRTTACSSARSPRGGSLTGLSAAAPARSNLKASGEFDLILVESVGVGQESDPFRIFGQGPKLVAPRSSCSPPTTAA